VENNAFLDILEKANSPKEFNDLCDDFFLFDYENIESKIDSNTHLNETYAGEELLESALNTSWYDYYLMIKYLKNNNLTLLDLGASYCKGSLLSSLLKFDNIHSVEIVKERIQFAKDTAKRLKLNEELYIHGDALTTDLSLFDVFFIYQPVGRLLNSLLNKLCENQVAKKLWLVESHGDLINRVTFDNRFTNEQSLLKFSSKRHDPNLYQFQIQDIKKRSELYFEDQFYQAKIVKMQSTNLILGNFEWVTKINSSDIDYLDKDPCVNLNDRRFNLYSKEDRIIDFSPKLTLFQEKYINELEITYNGKTQKILKVITLPEEGLELCSSGFVGKEILESI